MSTEITTTTDGMTAFADKSSFETAQRMVNALITSNMVPERYQGKENIGNALIALETAQRMRLPVLAVMQGMHIIHGKPSWSATFIISAINSSGRFSPLRFEYTGEGETRACYCWAYDLRDNSRVQAPAVTMAMAKAEGWSTRTGSKWKTMPELMLSYRAAAFFGRLYAPELLNGVQTADEVEDTYLQQANDQRAEALRRVQEAIKPEPEVINVTATATPPTNTEEAI